MKLDIEKAALEFIRKKGKIISISLSTPKSCCVSLSEPKVTFGKPKLVQNFYEYTIEDVSIYIDKIIEPKEEALGIKCNNVLGIKYLSVYGVKMFTL